MSDHILVPEEDLKHVLDLLSSSLDWGSGFLCDDDVAAWNRLAALVGMPQAHKVNRWNPYAPGTGDWVLEGPQLDAALESREKAREKIAYRTFDPDVVPMHVHGWRMSMRASATSVSFTSSVLIGGDNVTIEWVEDALNPPTESLL